MGDSSIGSPLLWGVFAVIVLAMLALDLGLHRKAKPPSMKEAAVWTSIWIAISLLFGGWVAWRYGMDRAQEYLTGYLIEKALSVDNLFVFFAVFAAFRIPREHEHRVLFWGVIGAIVFRTIMVFGGMALLSRFHWLVYPFGAVLIFTGVKMLVRKEDRPHPEDSRLMRLLRRIVPSTNELQGQRFFVIVEGVRRATPLFLALLFIELTDVLFALDSILAIFAVSDDPFILLTSNIFAVLGLRALYTLLADAARRFVYLQPGLALMLVFVGIKMAIGPIFHVPVLASLAVIALLLGGSIVASILKNRRDRTRRLAPPAPAR